MIEGSTGDLLTRATIWIAMLAWTGGIVIQGEKRERVTRWLWTDGLFLYGFHIFFAYSEFYQWSHEVAWEATARDTREMTGFDSGIGLLLNYAFALVLAIDVFRQWTTGSRKGARWINALVVFMIVNGAIVFASGPTRWFGIVLVAVILTALARRCIRARENS